MPWYAIITHPGQEFRVKAELERRAGLRLQEVVVPTERSTETRGGQKVHVETRTMPGYVLVDAELTDTVWLRLKGTPGVAGLAGAANRPVALPRPEVDRLLRRDTPRPVRVPYAVGDSVEVIEGPFVGLSGEVVAVNDDAARLKLLLEMFGRETPAEVSFDQVKAR
jgi:transcription termination/antitermination protein NusG